MDVHEIVDRVVQGTPGVSRPIAVGGAGRQTCRKLGTAGFGRFLVLIGTAPLLEMVQRQSTRSMSIISAGRSQAPCPTGEVEHSLAN
ncbi:hypothetical protein ACFT9I_02315 [Streptomyces sp. NPDC057137]|uniref:hypothetical protein n=1 Tax=Streptomyces sp. NPDC057137 TaxID=3346030 RepID=UPI0036381E06